MEQECFTPICFTGIPEPSIVEHFFFPFYCYCFDNSNLHPFLDKSDAEKYQINQTTLSHTKTRIARRKHLTSSVRFSTHLSISSIMSDRGSLISKKSDKWIRRTLRDTSSLTTCSKKPQSTSETSTKCFARNGSAIDKLFSARNVTS